MRRAMLILLLVLILTGAAARGGLAEAAADPGVCGDDCQSCQVLQTVALGSFADFDPNDSLSVRVFSAALPRLTAIAPADVNHYLMHFSLDRSVLMEDLYVAMGNCLWADTIITPEPEDEAAGQARRVLMLFLNPSGEENAAAQISAIRSHASQESLSLIAENAGVPLAFVTHLIQQ